MNEENTALRGEPLVYSEAEWRVRTDGLIRRHDRNFYLACSIPLIPYAILVAEAYLLDFYLIKIILAGFIAAVLTYIGGAIAIGRLHEHVRRSGPLGLYEEGLQVWPYYLVPFENIVFVSRNKRGIILRPRFGLKTSPSYFWWGNSWRLDERFLGNAGIDELLRRISRILEEREE